MNRVIEAIAPARLGSGFRWLLSSSWLTNLGDGVALAAGPLLIASQTRNPGLVALATILQRVPWLVFGLYAGWIADRVDRRRLILVANVFRTAVLVLLSLLIAADRIDVAVVLTAVFVLGTAETFADTAADTLLPMQVGRADLGLGNARLVFGRRAINDLAGPPLGATLFALGMVVPFAAQAVAVGLGAVLISRITASAPDQVSAHGGIRADVAAGVRWLLGNPPIRTLTLTVVLFNVTFGAVWPMLVLYSIEVLEMGEVGFGVLLAAGATGGVVGAIFYTRLERSFSLGNLMRVGLVVETLVHLGLAVSRLPILSMAILFAFGVQASVWGTTASAVRQRAVPQDFQGRVGSVYRLGVFGGMVAGGGIGALVSGWWGVVAPMWFAFVGSALLLAAIWRELPKIAHVDELAHVELSR